MSRGRLSSRRLRVVVNAVHAKSGGGVTYLRNLLPYFANDPEVELHLFIDADQFSLFDPIDERVRVHLFSFRPGLLRLLVWEQLSLPLIARMMAADVVFSPANYGPLLQKNLVIVLRNSLAVVGRETRLAKRIYWLGLACMTFLSLVRCRRAIAVSEYARQGLTFGLRRFLDRRIDVVHHGVGQNYLSASSSFHRLEPGVPEAFLLVVGDIYVQKNLHSLIEAFARLRRRYPALTLRIAGRNIDEDYFSELRSRIAELGLNDDIAFLGTIESGELEVLYKTCTVFVFPSTVETFGNPLVEAMACGAPVACSRTAAMPEIAADAVEFFDPLDIEDMTAALERLLDDQERRSSLAVKARDRATQFSWQKTADQTMRIIKSCRS